MSEKKRIDNPRELQVSREESFVRIEAGSLSLVLPVGLAEALARSLLESCGSKEKS